MKNGLCYHYNSMWNATPLLPGKKKENIKLEFVFFQIVWLVNKLISNLYRRRIPAFQINEV